MIARATSGKRAQCGVSEWFAAGQYQQAEQLFDDICAAGLKGIRLVVVLDQWNSTKERAWYRWLIAKAAERLEVVIALHRLPPYLYQQLSPAWVHQFSVYQRFFREVCEEMGDSAQWLELADPLGASAWPDTSSKSVGLLSSLSFEAASPICLGGLVLDAQWLAIADRQGLFDWVQALSFRQFSQADWANKLSKAARILTAKQVLEYWLVPDQLPSKIDGRVGLLPELLDLLGEGGCVSVEAGVESISDKGRDLLNKDCRLTTAQLQEWLIYARGKIPFVQASLLDSQADDSARVEEWRQTLLAHGVWANKPVPMFPYPGSPDYIKLWGIPDDLAWERAVNYYLKAFAEFSDIQEELPRPLEDLELGMAP